MLRRGVLGAIAARKAAFEETLMLASINGGLWIPGTHTGGAVVQTGATCS